MTYCGSERWGLCPLLLFRAASDQLLMKDGYLSLDSCLPDFMGKGGSNKYEAIKICKVK